MATFATTDGVTLHFEDRGSGQPLLLVHGWGTSAMVWNGQVTGLARSARPITLDWRGCGRSDHPATGNTIRRVAQDVVELADHLEVERPIIVGSSLGGNIALEATLAAPRRFAGLVLLDSPQHYFADGIDRAAFWAWHASLRRRRPETFEQMVGGWFGPETGEATRRWTVGQLLASGWFIDDLLADAASHDRRAQLPGLSIPVLLVHGRHDSEVPLDVPEQAARLLPDARMEILEGAGHMPHLEVPEAVNSLLGAFLAEL